MSATPPTPHPIPRTPLNWCAQTAVEYLESSESEGEDDPTDGDGKDEGKEEEEEDRREEARVQKLWVKRAKRRRVLAEVEQSAAGGDSQGPELLMQEVGERPSSRRGGIRSSVCSCWLVLGAVDNAPCLD